MRRKTIIVSALLLGTVLGYFIFNRFFYFGELIGIRGTFTYHRSTCMFVKKSSIDQLKFFDGIDDTVPDYRPCKACYPPSNKKEIEAFDAAYEEEQRLIAETEARKILYIRERFDKGEYVSPSDRELIGESKEITMRDVEMAVPLSEYKKRYGNSAKDFPIDSKLFGEKFRLTQMLDEAYGVKFENEAE